MLTQLPREIHCLLFSKLTARDAASLGATAKEFRDNLIFRKIQALRSYEINENISLVIDVLEEFGRQLDQKDFGVSTDQIVKTKNKWKDELSDGLVLDFEMHPDTQMFINEIKEHMLEKKVLLLVAECERCTLEDTSVYKDYQAELIFRKRLADSNGQIDIENQKYSPELVAALFLSIPKESNVQNKLPVVQKKHKKCSVM